MVRVEAAPRAGGDSVQNGSVQPRNGPCSGPALVITEKASWAGRIRSKLALHVSCLRPQHTGLPARPARIVPSRSLETGFLRSSFLPSLPSVILSFSKTPWCERIKANGVPLLQHLQNLVPFLPS